MSIHRVIPNSLVLTFILCFMSFSGIAQGQQQLWRTLNVNGADREYLVYLPTDFDPAEYMPVLFCYHGGDGTPNGMMQSYGDFRPQANLHRFIAVYPAAAEDSDGCRCWNSEGPFDNGIDDIEFSAAMIDAVVTEFNANPDRIYACGYSLGGSMMWELVCYLSDRYAAVGVVAANMWHWTRDACDNAAPTGVIHILGTNDFYAPYDGNQWSLSTVEQNEFVASLNGSDSVPSETDLGGGVTRFVYGQGAGCHTVEHYRRQGEGHDWPSFANDAIWNFVSQYDNSGLIGCTNVVPIAVESFNVTAGTLASGGLVELGSSDNLDLSARRNDSDVQSRVSLEVTAENITPSPSSLELVVEASVFARTQVNLFVDFFDYDAGSFVELSSGTAPRFNDSITVTAGSGDLARFVSSSGQLKARVRFRSLNTRQKFAANMDHVFWEVGQ